MQKALIHGTRVVQLEPVDGEFPVGGMTWVDAPDQVTTQYTYENGAFVPPPAPPPLPAVDDIELGRDDLLDIVLAKTNITPAELRAHRQKLRNEGKR